MSDILSNGNIIANRANTARTEDTTVIPVQHVDAGGTVGGVTLNTALDKTNDSITNYPAKASYAYQAAAAANVVVSATPAVLVGIIIGSDVGSAIVEVSDHASDGDGAVNIYLAGSTLMTSCKGYVPVNAYFATGITADITNQTNVTFIFIPD